jgi:hypothetical protein
MIIIHKSARNFLWLATGVITGCILAYVGKNIPSLFFTTIAFLLPFTLAIVVGVAKTTTA